MDWRTQIAVNRRKTLIVLFSFLLLYFLMGWFIAALLSPNLAMFSIAQLLDANTQYIILSFLAFSVAFILIAIFFGSRLSITGANAELVTKDSALYQMLYNVVEEMKIASKLQFMPKIYVLDVDYCNAFASGFDEKKSLIAVSKPLLSILSREELQAVVAHELSHIQHKDTMVITLVMVCANLLVNVIDVLCRRMLYGNQRSKKRNESGGVLMIFILLLRFILPVLTAFMVMYVSRRREFLADAGCVSMTRNPKGLAQALRKIHKAHEGSKKQYQDAYKNTSNESFRSLAYIYSPSECGIFNLYDMNMWFSTHPSLKDRLKALGYDHIDAGG
jgi:heat shock protein HtpX